MSNMLVLPPSYFVDTLVRQRRTALVLVLQFPFRGKPCLQDSQMSTKYLGGNFNILRISTAHGMALTFSLKNVIVFGRFWVPVCRLSVVAFSLEVCLVKNRLQRRKEATPWLPQQCPIPRE